jgi:AcrR family transcriptional regulator
MAGKRTLSRELITSTALDVVARDGLAALSMRRLAQELDVWPMSVYRHFRDKEDLLDAVAAAGADEMAMPRGRGSRQKRVAALATEARAMLERQPTDLRRRALASAGLVRLSDAAREALADGGLPLEDAAVAWHAVLAYVVGSIELDATTEAFEEGLERVLRGTITT